MKAKNYFLLLFPLAIIVIYLFELYMIDRKLDSIYDEGYLFLMIQAAHNGSTDGFSQWPSIVDALFSDKIISSILYLRYARFFTHLLSVILFSYVATWYLIKKKVIDSYRKGLLLVCIIFLLGSFNLGGIIIGYNILQEFFLLCIISSFLISSTCISSIKYYFYILIGFFFFFSLMTVLPSAILVFLAVLVLIFALNYKNRKALIVSYLSICFGVLIAMLIFHLFILDLRVIFHDILKATETVKHWDAGYDLPTLVAKLFLYLRDFYMGINLLLGLIVVCYFVNKFSNCYFAVLLFIFSLLLFAFYQIKPKMPLTSFLAFPIVLFFLLKLKSTSKISLRMINSYDVLYKVFLFFLPLLSSIGTNVYLGHKMEFFILPWGLLLVELMYDSKIRATYIKERTLILWLFFIIVIFQPFLGIVNEVGHLKDKRYYFRNDSPISRINLSIQQKKYYDNVYMIMKSYGYVPTEKVFSTQLDHMTLVAMKAKPNGIYFFPKIFLIDSQKSELAKPNFIFLNQNDTKLMCDSIKSLNWGFPEEYDSIYVGSPETINTGYPMDRTLYCLKRRKIQTN